MRAQVITHNEKISFSPGKEGKTKLPVDLTYGEIKVFVQGTYTLGTGTLHSDFPKNIFRSMRLKRNSDDGIYSGKSKDVRISNYFDQIGIEYFSAAAGKFEALFKLNKALLLADPNVLPEHHDHPFKGITQLDFEATAGDDTDAFSVDNGSSLDSIEATLIYERMTTSKEEIQSIFGSRLERYALPKVTAKETGTKDVGTELAEIANIGSANLHKRAFVVTLNSATGVEADDRIEKYQVKQTLPEDKELITTPFKAARADDKVYYGLSTLLTGVVAVDYDAEVTLDGKGLLVQPKEEALKLLAKVDNSAKFRYISEEYLVNREHVAQGGEVVFGTHL